MHCQENFLRRLAKGIASQFGKNCEVVIHDFTKGYENTIVAIENGHVTNRKVGSAASEIVLETMHNGCRWRQDPASYFMRTKGGRILKSTSIYLFDEKEEKTTGLFCINFDTTDLFMAENVINSIVNVNETAGEYVSEKEEIRTIPSNVNELLDILIDESMSFVGKPVVNMTKDDKIKAIKYLEEKGAFLIKKSGDRVSEFYNISKYTLYNYLSMNAEIEE